MAPKTIASIPELVDAAGTSGNVSTRLDRALTTPPSGSTLGDPDLARVVRAWPRLPEHVRRAILTLADGCQ